jgi:hypothetical protein
MDEEYKWLPELEQEIILTVNPRANEHLFILTAIDALTRGSDYDNQFVGFFSANTKSQSSAICS